MSRALRIYVSAPMRGVDDENRALFAEWATRLRACGFTVHSPPETSDFIEKRFAEMNRPIKPTIREFMAEDMRLICLQTDAVLVLDPTARSLSPNDALDRGERPNMSAAEACWRSGISPEV